MIARENLESRKQKLANHIGVLGLEKLECIDRADRVSEEMRQSAVLLRVFEATLADLEKDEKAVASMDEQLKSMAARILELEDQAGENGARVLDLESKLYPLGGMAEEDKEAE